MTPLKFYPKNFKNKKKVDIVFKSIKGADHFYENYKEEFFTIVNSYIENKLLEK